MCLWKSHLWSWKFYFVIVYQFPTWFEIKQNNQVTHESSNFFNLVQRIKNFSNKRAQEIALNVVQWNGYLHTQKIF